MAQMSRVEGISLQWGESLCWDDRRGRLYFVDCVARTLHWLDGVEPPAATLPMPSIPTAVVPTEDDRLVVALADGLHAVDPDAGSIELVARYPDGLGGRANDACADLHGNLVTGTLNLELGARAGSYWWYSTVHGWRRLDDGIGNANGPAVVERDGTSTLVFADTHAGVLYAYDYDGDAGTVSNRREFARTDEFGGMPDGACADADGGVWSCIFGAGKIARFTDGGADEVLDTGASLTSDVTFGGEGMDRLFFVSLSIGDDSPDAGALMAVEGVGRTGRPEPRVRL